MSRALYIIGVLFVVIWCMPLFIAISVAVFVTSGRPIFFRQRRVGFRGKQFVLYKFRTMKIGTDRERKLLFSKNESDGPTFKIRNDPRLTAFGKFLSHTGLDELPQLANVLQNDMAFIGPRPLPVYEANRLVPWMRKREAIKPGMISPAILSGNYHKSFFQWMRSDIEYAKSKNPALDARLFVSAALYLLSLVVSEVVRVRAEAR